MGKALLVLDEMPTRCEECDLLVSTEEWSDYCPVMHLPVNADEHVYGCQLKEPPDKLSMDDYDEHVPEDCEKLLKYYNDGFNDCINAILGEEE